MIPYLNYVPGLNLKVDQFPMLSLETVYSIGINEHSLGTRQ